LLAQPGCSDASVEHTSGTVGYADPLYIRTGVVTEGSEVYSFGMVLLELLTRRPPALQHVSGRIEYQFVHLEGELSRVKAMLDPRAMWPVIVSTGLGELALRCISKQEVNRPSFINIVKQLRQLITRKSQLVSERYATRTSSGSATRTSSRGEERPFLNSRADAIVGRRCAGSTTASIGCAGTASCPTRLYPAGKATLGSTGEPRKTKASGVEYNSNCQFKPFL